jgi:hypothetical protein
VVTHPKVVEALGFGFACRAFDTAGRDRPAEMRKMDPDAHASSTLGSAA